MTKREGRKNEQHAQIRKQLAAAVEAMSSSERAKLDRLLINVELIGDVQNAATKIGLSSNLLLKWLHTPEIRRVINHALTEAKRIAKEGTFVPLWWPLARWKSSRFRAKMASHNLKAAGAEIALAVENNDKAFFIRLGKCLSGEIDATLLDQRDHYLAGLLTRYPSITTKDAVDHLRRVGFPSITEENFRMLRKRLKSKVHTIHEHDTLPALMRQLKIRGA